MTQRRLFLGLSIAVILAGWAAQSDHWHWFDSTSRIESGIRELTLQITATTVLETTILGLLLRGAGDGFAGIGLGFRELVIAVRNPLVLRVLGSLLFVSLVIDNIQLNLGKHPTGSATIDAWLREPPVAPILHDWLDEPNGLVWMLVVSIVGAFREELERSFCLSRVLAVFGIPGLVVAIPVDTVLFAHQHLYQGHMAALHTGILAVAMSVVFLRTRRVAEPIVIHAALNLVRASVIFAFRSP